MHRHKLKKKMIYKWFYKNSVQIVSNNFKGILVRTYLQAENINVNMRIYVEVFQFYNKK